MLGSSLAHGSGFIDGALPQWAYVAALVGIGTLIGSRFGKIKARTIVSHIGAALGSFAVAISISALFVAAIVPSPPSGWAIWWWRSRPARWTR